MIIGFFRMVFYAVIAYLIYKFVMYVLAPRGQTGPRKQPQGRSGVMVKDEVCNTYLPMEDAIIERAGGVDHYFCSQECRGKFLAQSQGRTKSAGRTFF